MGTATPSAGESRFRAQANMENGWWVVRAGRQYLFSLSVCFGACHHPRHRWRVSTSVLECFLIKTTAKSSLTFVYLAYVSTSQSTNEGSRGRTSSRNLEVETVTSSMEKPCSPAHLACLITRPRVTCSGWPHP